MLFDILREKKNTMIETTIVIPTCNRNDSLLRAINSVLKQSYVNWELVIVNDGDDGNAIKKLVSHFDNDRIKLLNNQGIKGGNGARNTGIKNAKGIYIAFLDDDDEWVKDKLEKQIALIKNKNDPAWAGCYCGYFLYDENIWRKEAGLLEGKFLYEHLLQKNSIGSMSTLVIKRSVFQQIGYLDEDQMRHQDILFIVKYFEKFYLSCVKEALVKVYGHRSYDAKSLESAKLSLISQLEKKENTLNRRKKAQFYAYEYRTLAICFLSERDYIKFKHYMKLSITTCLLPIHKYIKVILILIDTIFKCQTINTFSRIRSRYQRIISARW